MTGRLFVVPLSRCSIFYRPPTSSVNKSAVGNWEEFANNPRPGPEPQATTTTTITSTATSAVTAIASTSNNYTSSIDTTNSYSPNVPTKLDTFSKGMFGNPFEL